MRVAHRRLKPLTYEFDVSEWVPPEPRGDDCQRPVGLRPQGGPLHLHQGYAFLRDKKTKRPLLVVEYQIPKAGRYAIACSVQDDQGGERTVVETLEVN